MQLGRVCGNVVSTRKTDRLNGFKILVVQPVSLETFEDKGAPFVSLDGVGAGDGELVMCVSGSSSRQTSETESKPVDNLIVAIIDSVDILGSRLFDKANPDLLSKRNENINERENALKSDKTIENQNNQVLELADIPNKVENVNKSIIAEASEEENIETNLDVVIEQLKSERLQQNKAANTDVKPKNSDKKVKPKH